MSRRAITEAADRRAAAISSARHVMEAAEAAERAEQQAARASDETAFMLMNPQTRAGQLIEFGVTSQIFTHPKDKRTEEYVTGRFG